MCSPVFLAARLGYLDVVRTLTGLGFDYTTTSRIDNEVFSPVEIAAKNGHVEIVKMLVEEHGVDVRDKLILWRAVQGGNIHVLKYLRQSGASVHVKVLSDLPTTHLGAIIFHFAQICEYLLSWSSEGICMDKTEEPTIFLASSTTDIYLARLFIDSGEHINNISILGRAGYYDPKTGKFLSSSLHFCSNGAYSNPFGESVGTSALMSAVRARDMDSVRFLCGHGADPAIPNMYGRTTLHAAINSKHMEIVRYLILDCKVKLSQVTSHSGPCEDYIATAVEAGSYDIAVFLVKAGCTLTPSHGRTALHAAIKSKHMKLVRFLVLDCNVNLLPDVPHTSPFEDYIITAVKARAYDIVVFLSKAGCTLTHRHYSVLEEICDTDPIEQCKEMTCFARQLLEGPPTLETLACWKIRYVIGGNMGFVGSLPLPKKLINLVKLSHI